MFPMLKSFIQSSSFESFTPRVVRAAILYFFSLYKVLSSSKVEKEMFKRFLSARRSLKYADLSLLDISHTAVNSL